LSLLYCLTVIALGYLSLSLIAPGKSTRALRAVLSPGVGLSLASLVLLLSYILVGPSRQALLAFDVALLVVLVAANILVRRSRFATKIPGPDFAPPREGSLPAAGGFLFLLLAAAATFAILSLDNPFGWADSISRWSSKAKLLFLNDANWRETFRNPWVLNRDYPLLLPGAIAHGWHFAQTATALIPQIIAASFLFGTIGVLVIAIRQLRGSVNGWLAGSVAAGSPLFIYHGASQYGDIPSGFFLLACFVTIAIADREQFAYQRWWVLAGFAAGSAIWLKNEGVLFTGSLLLARFVVAFSGRHLRRWVREILVFCAAAAPFVLAAALIKSWAPLNPALKAVVGLRPRRGFAATIDLLVRFSDDFTAIGSLLVSAPLLLAIYLVLVGVRVNPANTRTLWTIFLTLVVIAVGQAFVYVFYTPNSTEWHRRALLHQWPTMIFAFFLMARPPDEAASPDTAGEPSVVLP
jgi:hypothetical protein